MSFQTSSQSSSSSSTLSSSACEILRLPFEVHVYMLTYLRATDLSAVHRTCRTFHDKQLVRSTIQHFATLVYPPELTEGFDTPIVGGEVSIRTNGTGNDNDNGNDTNEHHNYEALRNMEMLVVARVLSRPEPPVSQRESGFYVSKSWCRAALRWLEVQAEERKQRANNATSNDGIKNGNGKHGHGHGHGGGKRQHKRSKKQERMRRRKLSDASPPWPNVNHDLTCHHGDLRCSNTTNNTVHHNHTTSPGSGSRAERAKRRVMDKQAWRILKKLYPDSVQLSLVQGECVHCALQVQTDKMTRDAHNQKLMQERKKPLACPLVRAFYTRTRGVPSHSLSQHNTNTTSNTNTTTIHFFSNGAPCPLVQGVYHALPRSWCHRWRKYLKSGEGGRPCAPDASACLCDGHNLPLVPPHLESFLYGETPALLSTLSNDANGSSTSPFASTSPSAAAVASPSAASVVALPTFRSNNVVTLSSLQSNAASTSTSSHDTTQMLASLRASGLSDVDIQAQRYAMMQIESQNNHHSQRHNRHTPPPSTPPPHNRPIHASTLTTTPDANPNTPPPTTTATRAEINAQLDRENRVVVEILTDEEFTALEKWWPEIHSSYALRFAVTHDHRTNCAEIVWTTPPCRECDASGIFQNHHLVVRNRNRNLSQKKHHVKR